MSRYLPDDGDRVVPLEPLGSLPASVHLLERAQAEAVNAALATGRPLLVRGLPGTGKSQLARAAAQALGWAYVSMVVDAHTETRDLLWSEDPVARLAQAQALGETRLTLEQLDALMAPRRFVRPGPLWWAFQWGDAEEQAILAGESGAYLRIATPEADPTRGCVVLVDEIDKADATVPNGLLEALGNGCFQTPYRTTVAMDRTRRPLVVITTNEERSMPDAFLRRCLVLHLELPREKHEVADFLRTRGELHFERLRAGTFLGEAAAHVADAHVTARDAGESPPGLAEYLDLVEAVASQRQGDGAQVELLRRVKGFALDKHAHERRG